jgi:hypothetical protein
MSDRGFFGRGCILAKAGASCNAQKARGQKARRAEGLSRPSRSSEKTTLAQGQTLTARASAGAPTAIFLIFMLFFVFCPCFASERPLARDFDRHKMKSRAMMRDRDQGESSVHLIRPGAAMAAHGARNV